ncbi:fatty acid desaturase family protein [Imhoffiella purpurea]|uniref:Fatty acid desaturase, type 2 n=1 Tax=Imhoffiella purpurea TaxID=1249627 RepID=W9V9H9_9GAMM|nr:fatty acid desaturase [Imhoffiella purpurea]EXJ13531.1 Fatty acid desaturase, type 2 [Imhoffiella purpurea]
MIERHYYRLRPLIYYGDFTLSMTGFVAAFVLCLHTTGLAFALSLFASSACLYRAGAFIHELTHQYRRGRLEGFYRLWNLTAGAVVMMPAVRFFDPHRTHHKTGIFSTRQDPQYMLLRTDWKLAVLVLLVSPFVMPIVSFLFMLAASLGERVDIEGAIERYLERKKGAAVGSALPQAYRREMTVYSRYYLVVVGLYVWLWPETIPLMYAVQVGAWWLGILRIPLEHEMRAYRETSGARDHVVDSFTVESPFAEILQPLSLRLHTAHHMYPGVPYHNLPALHRELKRSDPEYRRSVVPFMTAVLGPRRPASP